MLDVINATYEKATQIARTMHEISNSMESRISVSRFDELCEILRSDIVQFQSLSSKIQDPYTSLALREIEMEEYRLYRNNDKKFESFSLGNPATPGSAISYPMATTCVQLLQWASEARFCLQNPEKDRSLVSNDCPFKGQFYILTDRIYTEHHKVIGAWRQLNDCEPQDEVQDEERIYNLFVEFLHEGQKLVDSVGGTRDV